MKTPLLFALLAILFLLALWAILPPTNSGDIKKHVENEAILKHELKRLYFENKTLKSRDSLRAIAYQKAQDSVKILAQKAGKIRVVYLDARTATETRLDSTNLYREVMTARELIDAQESHINGLLELNAKADDLLALRLQIIENQDSTILTLKTRFDNMVEMKDKELKQERRKGNKKFFKGAALGGIVVGILVII
ncbi:MAG TPA: hypothetical protein PKN99_03100 [Cyclobacteriaceae bacterium]|nr:hypothetical protein [Cyclobacteriaceae bacterium]